MGKIKPSYLFFLMYMTQGALVLLLQLPQFVAQQFGYNGWLAIPFISIIGSLHIGLIYIVYRLGKGASIFTMLEYGIPKIVRILLFFFLSFFYAGFSIYILKNYLFIVRFLYFPHTNINWLLIVSILLVLYLVTKSIEPIVHNITLMFLLFAPITLLLLYFIPHISFLQLTNFYFDAHGQWKIGLLNLYVSFLGFEVLLFLFPYLEKGTKGFRYAFYGHLYTTFVYTATSFVCFSFNSLQQLKTQVYPVINLLQYIELEFIERVDSLFFLLFFLKVFSTGVIYLWIGVETFQRVLKWNRKTIAIILSVSGFLLTYTLVSQYEINQLFFYLAYIQLTISLFLPCLLILLIFLKRWRHNA